MVTVPDGTHPTSAPVGPLVATLVACGLVVAGAAAAPVAAATTTELSLVAQGDTTVAPGGSVTYEVVVGAVDDGVGSYIVAVDVSDASVATITNASDRTGGDSRVEVADGGSSVRVGAFAGNTTDDGTNVTVATVTVTGQSAGAADLRLEPESVSDETGDAYTLVNFFDATIAVEGDATPTPDGNSPTPADGTTTTSPAPTTATADATTPTDASPTSPEGGDATTDGTPPTSAIPTGGTGDDGDGGDDGTTTTGSPGFGTTVAVLALLGAALVALRRRI